MYLKQKSRSTGLSADVKLAKLSMIDLAGSERGTVAMAGGASRLREGANINKSLLALGESRKAFFSLKGMLSRTFRCGGGLLGPGVMGPDRSHPRRCLGSLLE